MIDDDDDHEPQQTQLDGAEDIYETDEEVQDPDCPYPPIVAELSLELGTGVLNLAVPPLLSSTVSQMPQLAKTHMTVAIACADSRVKVMSIPLAPPAPGTHEEYLENEVKAADLQGSKSITRDLAIKILSKAEESTSESRLPQQDDPRNEGRILVASTGSSLNVWNLPLSSGSISQTPTSLNPHFQSSVSGANVSFQSSPRLNNLILAEPSGSVRILSFQTATDRPTSRDSASVGPISSGDRGRWIMSYQTPFHTPENGSMALARRKKILSAAWVLSGRGILVLLEDGQWGVWDTSGHTQAAGKSVQDFALHGYLATASSSDTTAKQSQKKTSGTKLAPMTPNTRKAKAENLFTGPPKAKGAAPSGGISVSTSTTKAGHLDESVVLWYNDSIYSINSMQTFWQRSTGSASGDKTNFGGLYAPGLTHITDINLMNENITLISQFAPKSAIAASALGQMNVQKDLLVSAEHRYMILQHLRPQNPTREQLQSATERPVSRDQRMLDAGEADLGGVNRILDGMAGDGRVRRVGFAH